MTVKISFVLLSCLLLLSLTTYLKKWPPFWRDDGQGERVQSWRYLSRKVDQAEERISSSDLLLRDVADVILELRANTERLEDILKRLKEDDDGV